MNQITLRRCAAILIAILLLSQGLLPLSSFAEPDPDLPSDPMEVFQLPQEQIQCSFTDVSESDWFYAYAAYAQSIGLVQGRAANSFAPQGLMTVAEAITLSVRVYEAYHAIVPEASSGSVWYAPYVERAKSYGILPAGCDNYDAYVRRDQAAAIFCSTLPETELEACNEVEWLPDVGPDDPYYAQILTLYSAGVLSGVNSYGYFHPKQTVSRAELVKILCSVINPSLRGDFRLLAGDLTGFSERLTQDLSCSFTDVKPSDWYYRSVSIQEQLGIINGVGGNRFAPNGTVTVAQALKVAVEVYEQYHGLAHGSSEGTWYSYAVSKALESGILRAPLADYDRPATRGEIVTYLSRCLRAEDLQQINQVAALPDVLPADDAYESALLLYRAGILCGSGTERSANLELYVTRAELATLLTRLVLPEERQHFTLAATDFASFHYGISGSGKYLLSGYRLGHGDNVMVLSFAIHGWEDNWARDGEELVYLAEQTKAYLQARPELLNGWTVYILRCLNPDGLYLGNTNNGPGRCTTTRLDASGRLLTDRGIDMNRCFPFRYSANEGSRYYNGTAPLQCVEAQKLAAFMRKLPKANKRICIDVHGWLNEILTSKSNSAVCQTLHRYFPNMPQVTMYGSGYFSTWTYGELGFDSVLLELPSTIYSHNDFLHSGCIDRFTSAIADLLKSY